MGYFSRFMTSGFRLRSGNTHIYIFRILFPFSKFLLTSCGFCSKLILFYAKFPLKRVKFLAAFFFFFFFFFWSQAEEQVLRLLTNVRLLVKRHLMQIILGFKLTMDEVNTKKVCLWYFFRFMTSGLTLRSRNTYIYTFRVLFDFS